MLNKDSRFDIDLRRGVAVETKIASLINAGGPLIEVKAECSHWRRTGNIAVEFESRGKLSGIAVTQAHWWVYALVDNNRIEALIWLPTDKLKAIAKHYLLKDGYRLGGDNNTSKLVLVPIMAAMR